MLKIYNKTLFQKSLCLCILPSSLPCLKGEGPSETVEGFILNRELTMNHCRGGYHPPVKRISVFFKISFSLLPIHKEKKSPVFVERDERPFCRKKTAEKIPSKAINGENSRLCGMLLLNKTKLAESFAEKFEIRQKRNYNLISF